MSPELCVVRRIDHPAIGLPTARVEGHELRAAEDPHLVEAHPDLNPIANQRMRHAVTNRVDVDQRVVCHTAFEHLLALRKRERRKWLKRRTLPLFEAQSRCLVRRFVNTLVGDPTIADAICDRLLHNAHKIDL